MPLNLSTFLLACAVCVVGVGCQGGRVGQRAEIETAVRNVLEQQVRDWNAGNLGGFMNGYDRSDQTRFASGGDLTLGWQNVFDRYQRKYGTGAAMGTLAFSNITVTALSQGAAYAFGRWHLRRGADEFSGLFTLVFHATPDGWRIVHDHTSSASKP